jgi:hypothetical protein
MTAIPLAIRDDSRTFWMCCLRLPATAPVLPPAIGHLTAGENLHDSDIELWSFSSPLPLGTTIWLEPRERTAVSDVARFAIEHTTKGRWRVRATDEG